MSHFWRRKFLGLCFSLFTFVPIHLFSQESADEFNTFQEPVIDQNYSQEPQQDMPLDFPSELQSAEPLQTENTDIQDNNAQDPFANEFQNSDSQPSYLETQPSYTDTHTPGPVSYEKVSDLTLPYKQRRKTHGVLFSINYEDFYPSDYLSIIDNSHIDGFLDGSSAKMFGAEIGYKYNFSAGSLALLFQYAKGGSVGNKLGYDRSIEIEKMSLSANYAADMLMKEPYIIPYIQGSLSNFEIQEDDQNFEGANSAKMVMGYRFGLLFQLDWIEKSIDSKTHEQGLTSSGLQNTYLDLYVNNYMTPSNTLSASNPEGGADVTANMQLGLGLKMEF